MDLTKLRASLGVAAGVPDDQVLTQAAERIVRLDTEHKTALSRATAAEEQVVSLSRATAAEEPEVLKGFAELTNGRIDLALDKHEITPHIAATLKKRVMEGEKPNALMLSRDASGQRPIEWVLDLFKGSRLVPESGVQQLARETPGDVEKPKDATQAEIDAELSRTETGRRAMAARQAK